MTTFAKRLLGLIGGLAISSTAWGAVCPSGTLASVIALGNCSIGDATFFFTSPPAFAPPAGLPLYFPGPFAGNSGPGPASSQIQFTPVAELGNPGFTLTGAFTATGGFSFIPSSGLTVPGSFFDESLGYLHIALPAGQSFMGASVELTGAVVSTDNTGNLALVSLQTFGATVNTYLVGDGQAQLDSFVELEGGPYAAIPALINLRTWNRSTNTASVSKFDAVTFQFQESVSAIPEPESYAMLIAGLGLLGFMARRRRR